jgi:hypothetical protein
VFPAIRPRRGARLTLLAASLWVLVACGGDPTGTAPPTFQVGVLPDSAELLIGSMVGFNATVRNSQGQADTSAVISWSSSDPSVATVDSQGMVRAVSAGQAAIRASSRGASGSATVTAFPEPVLEQDFSDYSSTDDLRDSGDFRRDAVNEQYTFLDTDVGFALSDRSMRYDWPDTSGWDNLGANFFISTAQDIPVVSEFWVEVWMRFSDNFTVDGPADGNPDHKTLFLHSLPDGTGRWQFKIATCCAGGEATMRAGVPGQGFAWIGQGDEYRPQKSVRYWDNTWTGMRLHGKADSPRAFEVWINRAQSGWVQVFSADDVDEQDPSVFAADRVIYGANINQGSFGDMSLWWGRIRVWDEDPAW